MRFLFLTPNELKVFTKNGRQWILCESSYFVLWLWVIGLCNEIVDTVNIIHLPLTYNYK